MIDKDGSDDNPAVVSGVSGTDKEPKEGIKGEEIQFLRFPQVS